MAALIGIKLANGDFYPILDEKSAQKKRLVLTTVTDNQTGVQIDLYRSLIKSIKGARYIGTLVVENIKPKKKGDASIEMIIEYALEGEITATASDMDGEGECQHLSVSLKAFEEAKEDFDIVDEDIIEKDPPALKEENGGFSKNAHFGGEPEAPSKRGVLGVVLLALFALLLAAAAIWIFLFDGKDVLGLGGAEPEPEPLPRSAPVIIKAPPAPPPAAETAANIAAANIAAANTDAASAADGAASTADSATSTADGAASGTDAASAADGANTASGGAVASPPPTPPPPPAAPPAAADNAVSPAEPVKQPASTRRRVTPPVSNYPVPSPIPREGIWYTIRWGDTLWAISEAFYRNPWDYRFLARENNIRKPSLIIAGNEIKIPPRY